MNANKYFKKHGYEKCKAACAQNGWLNTGFWIQLKRLVESHDLVEKHGGLERVKKVIDGKHIGYTHFYLHSNGRYVFLDHYVDFIPDHAQHIGMFNKVIADVESCL